jgi:histidine triad (HIT) family protein
MKDDCLFCKIVRKEIPANIVYENEYVLAFLDINPVSNGHTLVIPKEHFENFSETKEPYLTAVNQAKQIIAKMLLNSSLKPQGINYLSNQAAIAKQNVFHYHEHILPKYQKGIGFEMKVNPQDLKNLEEVLTILKK